MNPSQTSLLVFSIIFSAAIAGMALGSFLPSHHLADQSKEIIKAARSVVVGLAALTLGLLIADAKTSFDEKEKELKSSASRVILLDHVLVEFGPGAKSARMTLRDVVQSGIDSITAMQTQTPDLEHTNGAERIRRLLTQILALKPENESQSWLRQTALTMTKDVTQSRWMIYQDLTTNIDGHFIAVLVFWLASIFLSLGLIAPVNASVVVALLVASASMAGSIFLTLELDMPYGGFIHLSETPLRLALTQLAPI